MPATLGYEDVVRMLRCAAARVKENRELLSKLDSAIGDGDHGTTMVRVVEAMLQAIQECPRKSLGAMLESAGWGVMSVDGGSTSPLLGSLLLGMAEGVEGKEALDTPALAAMFQAGLVRLSAQTPAKVGDKTMLDALVPAVDALKSAGGGDVAAAIRQAADAATRGAEATKDMRARFGRARNLGDRTVGHQDPGATSISCIFQGLAEGASAK
jgi:dihydroxyacetone kinase-like protein